MREDSSQGSVGVEHHSESRSHSLGWKVSGKLCSDNTVASVWLHDLSPNGSESCVVFETLDLIDVSDSLAKVETCVLLLVDTLDLEQSEVFILV